MSDELGAPLAVLFDWDGTLVDSYASIVAAHNAVQDHFGDPHFTPEHVLEIVQLGHGREIFERLYDGNKEKAQEALDVYYAHIPKLRHDKLTFCPGALDLIETLNTYKVPIGVVSNMAHGALRDEISDLGMAQKFGTIIGAGEAARGKPDPAPIYLALERLGFSRWDAPDIWFVGDMQADQKAAKAAGCPFIFYTGGIAPTEHKRNLAAAKRLDHYDELGVMVKKIFESAE